MKPPRRYGTETWCSRTIITASARTPSSAGTYARRPRPAPPRTAAAGAAVEVAVPIAGEEASRCRARRLARRARRVSRVLRHNPGDGPLGALARGRRAGGVGCGALDRARDRAAAFVLRGL